MEYRWGGFGYCYSCGNYYYTTYSVSDYNILCAMCPLCGLTGLEREDFLFQSRLHQLMAILWLLPTTDRSRYALCLVSVIMSEIPTLLGLHIPILSRNLFPSWIVKCNMNVLKSRLGNLPFQCFGTF